jgi:hypothetical protein
MGEIDFLNEKYKGALAYGCLPTKTHNILIVCTKLGETTSLPYKVEGAKTNTPSKINTYKCLPITNTLLP